ncbi:hypothetical protein BH10CYA1_BH10CYA1_07680 [soil metagenome]
MTRLIAGLGSVLATLMCCSAALAIGYPKKVFDATYEITSPSGPSTMRMTSDGKGHMRTETKSGGSKFVTIADYPGLVSITLLEAQKMAIKTKLSQDSYQGSETADMKKKGAKDLGSKVVAGHPCHGYEYNSAGKFLTQIWLGNDIDWFVQSSATLPTGKSVTTLKSFTTKAPDSALFSMTPPAGYKVSGP